MKTRAEKAHDRARRLGQQLARAKNQLERAVAVIREKNDTIERMARRIKELRDLSGYYAGQSQQLFDRDMKEAAYA